MYSSTWNSSRTSAFGRDRHDDDSSYVSHWGYRHRHGGGDHDGYGSHGWHDCKPPVEPTILSVGDSSAVEGEKEIFAVTLSGKVVSSLTVSLALSDISAAAGQDYRNALEVSLDGGSTWKSTNCGSIKLCAGVDDFLVRVATIDDSKVESDETFKLKVAANGSSDSGIGTIVDNDQTGTTPQVLSVGDASTVEGGHAVFTVTLSEAGSSAVDVALALAAGSAGAGADYANGMEASFDGGASWSVVSGGSVSVPAGAATFLVRVAGIDDLLLETDEGFTLTAGTPGGSATGDGIIIDNDVALPAYTIGNDSRFEGESLVFDLSFQSTPLTAGVIQLTLADDTAVLGQDYLDGIEVSRDGGASWTLLAGGLLDVAAGEGALQLRVNTQDDVELEPLETFTLSARQLATGSVVTGIGEIIDNDTAVARVPPQTAVALQVADVLQDDGSVIPDAGGSACPAPASSALAQAELLVCADEIARQLAAAKPAEYA